MKLRILTAMLVAAATAGCATGTGQSTPYAGSAPAAQRQSGTSAEQACRTAVARQVGISDPSSLRVIGSEASQVGTSVRVSVPGAQAPWACVIDTDGTVVNVYYTAEG